MTQEAEPLEAGDGSQPLGQCAAEAAAIAERFEEGLSEAADFAEDNVKQAFVEVFVGGLPPDATDEGVQSVFAAVGEVLSIRLNRRKKTGECKGFGFIRFADQLTAERACLEVKEACGKPVGVHISRARSAEQAAEEQFSSLPDDFDPDTGINRLLRLIRNHSDKRVVIAAALKAVLAVPSKPKAGAATDRTAERSSRANSEALPDLEAKKRVREDPFLPDPATFLEAFPRCKHLVDTFRANPNTHNKTPLAILHEYATRLSLELVYNESADSNLGPFTVEAKLTSIGGAVLYATGQGRGRGKKDAKQVAAAAVLEMLLANVPQSDFLQPGKAKVLKVQIAPKPALGGSVRAGLALRGRGRGRWAFGRATRPLDFAGANDLASLGVRGAAPDLGQYPIFPTHQDMIESVDLYNLAAASGTDPKARSFNRQEADLLGNNRGSSLDALTTIHRQLAGLPPIGQEAPLGMYGNSRSFDNSGFTFSAVQAADGTFLLAQQPQQQQQNHHPVGTLPDASSGGSLNVPTLSRQQLAAGAYGLPTSLQQFQQPY